MGPYDSVTQGWPKRTSPQQTRDFFVRADVGGCELLEDDFPKTFQILAEQWRRETGMLSSITKKLNHHAYQKIKNGGLIHSSLKN